MDYTKSDNSAQNKYDKRDNEDRNIVLNSKANFPRATPKDSYIFMEFTRNQLTILGLCGLANVFRAAVVLIGGPFFPAEAAAKGATGTEIGIIFAAQDITVFFWSFLCGKVILNQVGPQRLILLSFLGIGICTILFGCTVLIQDRILFVGTSIFIRILNGICDCGIYPAVFTIFSVETPNTISTAIALFEVFFGFGAIGGPVLCGLIIESVGFTWTYAILGSSILASTLLILLFVPKIQNCSPSVLSLQYNDYSTEAHQLGQQRGRFHNPGFWRLLKIPTVLLVIFSLSTTSASIGFVTATFSLHYDFLSPSMQGALFSTGTAIYTVACPLWGYISDNQIISKSAIMVLSAIILSIGYSFLGPLPFIPLERTTWTGFVGYAIMSLGIGGSIMTAYHNAMEAAVLEGFPKDSRTYGLVSSLYIATFSLGNSVGPTVSGIMYDHVGFKWGTVFIITLAILVVIATILLRLFNLIKGIERMG